MLMCLDSTVTTALLKCLDSTVTTALLKCMDSSVTTALLLRDREREQHQHERQAQRAKIGMIWRVNHRNQTLIVFLIQATPKTDSLKIEIGFTL